MDYQRLQPSGPLPATRRVKMFQMPAEYGGMWVPLLWTRRISDDEGEAVVLFQRDPVQTMKVNFSWAAHLLLPETLIEW